MGDCVAFLEKPSFYMTVTDIDPSRDKEEDSYYYRESGISQKRLRTRLRQMETAFKKIGNPGKITAHINKLWFKRAISTLVDFPDSSDLVKVLNIENTIKISTKTDVREFSGHFSLGYIVKVPEDHELFFKIFKKYQSIDLGEITFDKIDFCYFSSMSRYFPLLTKNLVTGEVEEHEEAIKRVESYQTKKVFRRAERLISAIVKQKHQHSSEVSDIITRSEDSLEVKVFSMKKGAQSNKYFLRSVSGSNPFGDRPRQEVLHVLEGKIRCVFYSKDNEYIGEQIISKGDTVLFAEAHQVFSEEDSTVLEIKQGPCLGSEKQDKVILVDTIDEIPAGQIEIAEDETYSTFKKDKRLIGAVVKAGHIPGAKQKRFTSIDDPFYFNSFLRKKGWKGAELFHASVKEKNLFNDSPRLEVLFILRGKARVFSNTNEDEDISGNILTAGDTVLFTEGHVVEFLEDTVFLEVRQGLYFPSGNNNESDSRVQVTPISLREIDLNEDILGLKNTEQSI